MLATDYYLFSFFFACCKYGDQNKTKNHIIFVCLWYVHGTCMYLPYFRGYWSMGYTTNVNGTSTLNHWKLPNMLLCVTDTAFEQ